jgi:hypothetical protein
MTVAKFIDKMHNLKMHHVVLALAQTEGDMDTTAVIVMYGVQKRGRCLFEL